MAWTRERLEDVARVRLDGAKLVVVANREPYIHVYEGDEIRCMKPASGLTTALDPVMRVCGGVWVGHGSGDADRRMADEHGRVAVPPDEPSYTLRRIWLSKDEEQGYYYGIANEGLWPLCHVVYTRPAFDPGHWEQYRAVNQRFADAVLQEVGEDDAVVFVQDYHFALLPRMLKRLRPDMVVIHFWHIPWPNREVMRIFPWQHELLEGLLGNDLLAFHTQYHCNNFLDTVDRAMEARVDTERFSVTREGHTTLVQPHPISIDAEYAESFPADVLRQEQDALRRRFRLHHRLLVGVDRVDYTKGLAERFHAVDHLLNSAPELKGSFQLLQIGAPSRVHIPAYRDLNETLESLADEINWRHSSGSWRPILYINQHFGAQQIYALYQMAAGCIVSSLHDGMNLVAKEFVASRGDGLGVLVLSRFTGAARELPDALLINPYDVAQFAAAIRQALEMPLEEQRHRMARMRRQVTDNNIFRWAGQLLSAGAKLRGVSVSQ
jgi:trehalose 6-phosphate synthase